MSFEGWHWLARGLEAAVVREVAWCVESIRYEHKSRKEIWQQVCSIPGLVIANAIWLGQLLQSTFDAHCGMKLLSDCGSECSWIAFLADVLFSSHAPGYYVVGDAGLLCSDSGVRPASIQVILLNRSGCESPGCTGASDAVGVRHSTECCFILLWARALGIVRVQWSTRTWSICFLESRFYWHRL